MQKICLSTRFTAGFFFYPTLSAREVEAGASAGGRKQYQDSPGKSSKAPYKPENGEKRNRPAAAKKSIVLLGHPGPEPRGETETPLSSLQSSRKS